MLGLQLATDPYWANLAIRNLPEVLTDHAYCEQKAASNAISLINHYPQHAELVRVMAQIAQEEMAHFEQVHALMSQRGYSLGPQRRDEYVHELLAYIRKGSREELLIDRLLFAAMIEARSCERFRLLSQTVDDVELAEFYHRLMASEAGHYATFIKLARQYANPAAVDARWQEWLAYEAEVVQRYGKKETMHG